MAKYRKIDENISRRGYGYIENALMSYIGMYYDELISGEKTLLDICKMTVSEFRDNPKIKIHYSSREDRMEIYRMAKECMVRYEDYLASQEGAVDEIPPVSDAFDNDVNESKIIKLTEGQLKQMISESVRKAINEIGDTQRGLEFIKRAKTKANHQGRYMQGDKFRKYGEKLDDGTIRSITDDYILYYNLDGKDIRLSKDGIIHVNGKNNGETFTVGMPILKVWNKRAARLIARWITNHTNQTADWHQLAEL